jgi:hypothetical protein
MKQCAVVPLTRSEDVDAATVPVAGEAPLVRVIRSVLGVVATDDVVVATLPALAAVVQECLRTSGLTTAVAVTRGPGSRRQVIRAGLEHLDVPPHGPASVLICDHRYPLSSGAVAAGVLAALASGGDVVVPVLAVTDTVKTVDELGSVLSTVDRGPACGTRRGRGRRRPRCGSGGVAARRAPAGGRHRVPVRLILSCRSRSASRTSGAKVTFRLVAAPGKTPTSTSV